MNQTNQKIIHSVFFPINYKRLKKVGEQQDENKRSKKENDPAISFEIIQGIGLTQEFFYVTN